LLIFDKVTHKSKLLKVYFTNLALGNHRELNPHFVELLTLLLYIVIILFRQFARSSH